MLRLLFLCLVFILSTDTAGTQQTRNTIFKDVRTTISVDYKYLFHFPDNDELAIDGRLPLIVFLHGAGERGTDIELVKVHGPPKIVETQGRFPFAVLSPQCKEGNSWNPVTLDLLLDEIVGEHAIDPSRIYLTGLSMGGRGTWDWAMYRPDRFAAIAPICGWGERFQVKKIQDVPTWVFHGGIDQVVPVQESSDMVRALEAIGNKEVKFTVYPKSGHDSWSETYQDPALYEWFLSHRKN